MRIHTCISHRARAPRARRAALLGAAVAAYFAAGSAHAALTPATDPGWQSPQTQAGQNRAGWVQSTPAQASMEQAYVQLPKPDQGGPGWHPMTAMRGKQGGPGRPAPDVLVDESTHLAKPVAGSTMTSGNALTPDRAAIAVDIQFPPNSTSLSGEAVAALNGVAATAGDLPGRILVTARADPIEQNAQGPDISIARAHTVRSYLARAGVDPQRIVVQAVGNTQARVDASRCEGMSGADLKSWLAADRTVTVQVGRLDVGMADPGVVIGVIYGE